VDQPASEAASTPSLHRAQRARAIVNPVSGRHDVEATSAQLRTVLRDHVSEVDVRVTREGGDAYRWAADAADLGVDLLVVVGGDGTVAAVLDGARRAAVPVPVAIVPLGTANGVARANNCTKNDAIKVSRMTERYLKIV